MKQLPLIREGSSTKPGDLGFLFGSGGAFPSDRFFLADSFVFPSPDCGNPLVLCDIAIYCANEVDIPS
jgi:hypothetical protein